MPIETIRYLTTIHFGEGAVARLSAELTDLGIARPLIVTDAPLRELGLVDAALEQAGLNGPPVFSGTPRTRPRRPRTPLRSGSARTSATGSWRSGAALPSTWPRRSPFG